MARRRYAGYIVLWDGVPCEYDGRRLYRGCVVSPGSHMSFVTRGCCVIASLADARRAISRTKAELVSILGPGYAMPTFLLARVYA